MNYNDHDLEILGKTIWAESRSETEQGRLAVAWVIRNRAERVAYAGHLLGEPGAIAVVCLAPWQFSCWNADDPNLPKIEALSLEDYADEHDLAGDVLEGIAADPTGGADCYYAPAGMPGGVAPPWAAAMRFCGKFGTQLFYDSRVPATRHVLFEGCAMPGEVKRMQAALHVDPEDGVFGDETKAAVVAYQAAHALAVDGVAGPATLGALGIA